MEKVVYNNYSGGAIGADTAWDQIGRSYGFHNHTHFYYGTRTPLGNTPLTASKLEHGWAHVLKANLTLKRNGIEKYKNLLARNYYQVLYSDAIFAIASIDLATGIVKGGTGWAVQMALDLNKPVYLFDQDRQEWLKITTLGSLISIEFIPPPSLTPNYAGIGSRKITPAGIQAIRDVYQNTSKRHETTNN